MPTARRRPAPAGAAAAPPAAPMFFETAADFGRWLARHGAAAPELIVGYRKVGSGQPSMTWPASVDEALCHGWIDGVRRRIDDEAYQIRFTPRRAGSVWSRVNIAKAEALIAQGRMTPAGLAAFERRRAEKSGVYAFERDRPAELSAAQERAFKRHKSAWAWFKAAPPSRQRVLLHWVTSAKQEATRERRLAKLIQACAGRQPL